jgi:hypothetical protein
MCGSGMTGSTRIQISEWPGRDAADPGFLDHRNRRLLGGLARLEKRREVRPLAHLGNAQLKRAEAGVEAALAIAIAVIEPIRWGVSARQNMRSNLLFRDFRQAAYVDDAETRRRRIYTEQVHPG